MKRLTTPNTDPTARGGFTLLELLIVIAIIAILMSLIIPAIAGARRRAQEAAVATELTQLDQAIGRDVMEHRRDASGRQPK